MKDATIYPTDTLETKRKKAAALLDKTIEQHEAILVTWALTAPGVPSYVKQFIFSALATYKFANQKEEHNVNSG